MRLAIIGVGLIGGSVGMAARRRLGAEVVRGDLTDLASMHRVVEGCARIYFGMSV